MSLRRKTGLEPVQLAIDGSSFVPVLEDLANDPAITRHGALAYQDNVIASSDGENAAARVSSRAWQRHAARPRLFRTSRQPKPR